MHHRKTRRASYAGGFILSTLSLPFKNLIVFFQCMLDLLKQFTHGFFLLYDASGFHPARLICSVIIIKQEFEKRKYPYQMTSDRILL